MALLPLLLLLLAVIFLSSLFVWKLKVTGSQVIPGPLPLPFIGHLHLLLRGPPHVVLGALAKKYGSIMFLRFGVVPVVVISSQRWAKEFLKANDTAFASRPQFSAGKMLLGYDGEDMVFAPYGDRWKQLRRITAELFTAQALKEARISEVRALVASIQHFSSHSPDACINISRKLKQLTFNIITMMLVSKRFFANDNADDAEEAREFINLMEETFRMAGAFPASDYLPYSLVRWLNVDQDNRIKALSHANRHFVDTLVTEHKLKVQERKGSSARSPMDFLELLLHRKDVIDVLQGNTIKGLLINLLQAATDTTYVSLEWTMAVVGAGLGGLALAAGLHSRGIRAHVFEKSSSLAADTATAISLSRNASRALDGICDGLSASIKAVASITRSTKLTMSGGGNDQTLSTSNGFLTSYGADGGDELYIVKWHSARLILASLVPDPYIHCSHTLLDYSMEEDQPGDRGGDVVALRFQLGGGEIATIRARFVVGADGINSAVRRWMNPSGEDPRDLHLINWNALVYNPGRFSVHDRDQMAMIRDGPSLCFLVDAGGDYTMWVFRVEDRSTGLGSSCGFSDESAKARVLREIDKLIESSSPAWKSLRIAVEATEAGGIFQRRVKDRLPLKSWSDLDHRVLLIGDAAHAMHWGPGQGARTAFEDAHQLCDLLSPGLKAGNREQTKQAVIRFQELRIPRLTKFQGFAAETTSISEFVPDWVEKLTPIERRSRMKEFLRWADSYPENMTSVYFK